MKHRFCINTFLLLLFISFTFSLLTAASDTITPSPLPQSLRALSTTLSSSSSSSSSTHVLPAITSSLHREFDASEAGFHRTIVTRVTIDDASALSLHKEGDIAHCRLVLRESLPKSFYFDLYQLRALTKFHSLFDDSLGVIHVYSERDIELERSTEISREEDVWIDVPRPVWHPVAANGNDAVASSTKRQSYTTTIRTPIHARYQAARSNATHAEATMGPPQAYISCPSSSSSSSATAAASSDNWRRLLPSSPSATLGNTISLRVPVGNLDDLMLVRYGTFFVTMTTAIALCVGIYAKSRQATKRS